MGNWKRAIIKSIVWRIFGIVLLFLISYFITGNFTETTIITIVFHTIRVILYVFHEEMWDKLWPL